MQKAPPSNSTIAWMASQHAMPLPLQHAAIAFGMTSIGSRPNSQRTISIVCGNKNHSGPEWPLHAQHLGRHVDRVAQPGVGHHRRAELAALHVAFRAHEQRMPARVEIHHEVTLRLRRRPRPWRARRQRWSPAAFRPARACPRPASRRPARGADGPASRWLPPRRHWPPARPGWSSTRSRTVRRRSARGP